MKKLIVASCLIIGLSCSSTNAQEIVPSEAHERCLENAGVSDPAIFNCLVDERSRQDDLLNATYKKVMAKFSTKGKESLKRAQRKWIKYRDTSCNLLSAYTESGGGWLAKQEPIECEARITAARVIELRRLAPYSE